MNYFENKQTGERLKVEEDDGDYVLDVWVKADENSTFGGLVRSP